MTATQDELLANDYPPRPQNPSDLAEWQHFVSSPIHWGDECDMVPLAGVTPSSSTDTTGPAPDFQVNNNNTWAGYIDHGNIYTDAMANWYIAAASGQHVDDDLSTWVGVGLGESDAYPLVQAGTNSNGDGTADIFIETAPDENEVLKDSDFSPVATGQHIFVHVTFNTDSEAFHIIDYATNEDHNYQEYYSGTPDGHAEFINERLCVNNTVHEIPAWFGDNPFDGAQSAYSGQWHDGGQLNTFYEDQMVDTHTGDDLLIPGGWDSSLESFNNPWAGYYGTAGAQCGL